jgi:hypothetical protein
MTWMTNARHSLGWSEDTATALEPLRRWYGENKSRLYWDEERGEVRLAT